MPSGIQTLKRPRSTPPPSLINFVFPPELNFTDLFQVHYWLDDIQCKGNETSLLDCNHAALGDHNCADREIAIVLCK